MKGILFLCTKTLVSESAEFQQTNHNLQEQGKKNQISLAMQFNLCIITAAEIQLNVNLMQMMI